MTDIKTFTFAVYNLDADPPFDAFLMDVPSIDGDEDKAARRAYWTAFHKLGAAGIEPEDFQVACWRNDAPGPAVHMGGIVR
jgi:hypothetical protein